MTVSSIGPKAAGCLVTIQDIPRICASCVVYGAMVGYGACIGVLGSALPVLAHKLSVPNTDLGVLFAYRGVGYFCGGMLSAYVLNRYDSKQILSKQLLVFLSIAISGIATVSLALTESFILIKLLFMMQGMGFGGVDTFGTISLSEMWGQRVQPWLQAKSAVFAVGGITGPVIISSLGLDLTFVVCGLLCATSALGLFVEYIAVNSQYADSVNGISSPVAASSPRSSPRISAPASRSETIIQEICSYAPVGPTDLLSEELAVLETVIEDLDPAESIATMSELDDLVHDTLIDQEHNLLQREHSLLYRDRYSVPASPSGPGINRTLSFATPRMVDKIAEFPDSTIALVPATVKGLLAVQMFTYVGLYYAYAGWVPTFVIMRGLSDDPSDAAFVATLYYTTMTAGSILSIPLAVCLSTTTMLRTQLTLVGAGILGLVILPSSMVSLCVVSGIIGYAVSCMFPLILTLPNDYGLTIDAGSTSMIVMGGTVGESFVPVVIGTLMSIFGPVAMTISFALMSSAIIIVYLYVHLRLSNVASVIHEKHEVNSGSNNSGQSKPLLATSVHDNGGHKKMYNSIVHVVPPMERIEEL